MSKTFTTPWSQMEDDLDERQAGGSAAPAGAGDAPDADWSDDPASPLRCRSSALQVNAQWSFFPLGGAVAWLAWSLVSRQGGAPGLSLGAALGILLLLLATGGLLVGARLTRRAAIHGFHRALMQDDSRVEELVQKLPIAAEMQPIWRAVQHHSANIQQRIGELLDQHKQVSLELSLTDAQKRQLEAVVQSVADPLLVIDAFDQVLLMNAAAAGLFKVDSKQTLRKPLSEIISDEKLVRIIRQAREADSRAAHRRFEHDLESRTYAVSMTPLSSGTPAVEDPPENPAESHGLVALFRDITKDREATRMKSEFVARAAHELRTPLTSIRAYVEMLVDGEAADEKTRREYLDIIQTSADRLGRMIDNILNISRIEAGTIRINKEPVAVSMVTKEAIDVVRPQAEAKKLTLTDELTPVVYRVAADRDMLYQAILNLLSNAIKYTPEGGKVHVRMTPREADRTISVEVSDTGVGIPREDLPRMFEKFFRVAANQKMAKGTGLGLNLVRHVVETIHEGKVTLASEVGKGSTFGMILPLCS